MEVTGVVFRQAPGFCSTTADASNSRHCHSLSTVKKPNSFYPKQQLNRKSFAACVISDEFSDKGHLQYYNGPRMAVKEKEEMGSKKKEMKKKLKLLKGLSKNLSTFSEMGFCLHPDDGLDQQVKGQMISEATEVLLGQLQKLKEEKMESKRMKKEEKAKKKASRMRMMMMMMNMKTTDCKDSSSSSSESSSSESDCDTVVNMSQLKKTNTSTSIPHQDEPSPLQILEKAESRVIGSDVYVGEEEEEEECGKKIEVCMGGKCKKSGGAVLLENFQKAVGGGAEVVGCKCMGKCREGPNVKVHSGHVSVTSSLCIGVGLEDVDSIVTNFFGGSQRSCSPALSAL